MATIAQERYLVATVIDYQEETIKFLIGLNSKVTIPGCYMSAQVASCKISLQSIKPGGYAQSPGKNNDWAINQWCGYEACFAFPSLIQ